MARTISGQTVLPDLPPSPRMTQFPSINLAADTLPAFNAMGQGLAPNAPLPAPPQMPKGQKYSIPAGDNISMAEAVMGKGYGQGIVSNSHRPAHPEIKFAEFSWIWAQMLQHILEIIPYEDRTSVPKHSISDHLTQWKCMEVALL